MSDIFVFFVMLLFFLYGLTRPAVAFAGYVWVDTVVPQKVVFGFMSGKPISMVMAILCFFSLVIGFRKLKFPNSSAHLFLLVFFLIWITLSTYQAVFPAHAWLKWDTSFKTILMSILMLFAVTNRKQLELVVVVLVCSIMFFMISAGLKTATGGGGYGAVLIVGSNNTGMSESSTLAGFAVLVMPLLIFLKDHSLLFPMLKGKKWIWYPALLLAFASVVGSTARTGLIALAAYLGKNMMAFKNILKVGVASALCIFVLAMFAPSSWLERMNTLNNVEGESSAMGRVAVWKWTIDFVSERPFFGGGFESYLANYGKLGDYVNGFDFGAKAFHSIYFEVLGENGYVGLFVYLLIILLSVLLNRKIYRMRQCDEWSVQFARCLNSAIFIFCIAGAFIGIAYRPIIFQLVAMSVINYSIVMREVYAIEKRK